MFVALSTDGSFGGPFYQSLTVIVLLSLLANTNGNGELLVDDDHQRAIAATKNEYLARSSQLGKNKVHMPIMVKKRIISKLRKLITNVRSINRSLKEEINRLETKHNVDYGLKQGHIERTQSIPEHSVTNRKSRVLTSVGRPEDATAHPKTSKPTTKEVVASPLVTATSTSTLQVTKNAKSPAPTEKLFHKVPTTDQRSSQKDKRPPPPPPFKNIKRKGCHYNTAKDCNLARRCIWCQIDKNCIFKSEYENSCRSKVNSGGDSALLLQAKNTSHELCFSKRSCRACIKMSQCVWCESSQACLMYKPVEVLSVDCPSNKWYWKSCPYQPTIFLIMLPILVTISLLVLIAICIKYYRSHKRKVKLFHEEPSIGNSLFRWKGKSKIYAAGSDENEEFLADKVRQKYHIVDHRKKRPESFGPGDKKSPRKSGRLSPGLAMEGKPRAASFGPSSSGSSPRRSREYPGF